MSPKSYKFVTPGCAYVTDEVEASVAVEFLKMHVGQVHGIASKPEKPKKPVLEMSGNTIDSLEWDAFTHKFSVYKKLSGISENAGSHFLDCLSKEVYGILFSTYGSDISNQDEKTLSANLKRLVVRKKNKLLNIMELLALRQDSDERILNFISRIKAKARHCDLSVSCSCGLSVDFKDTFTLYMLVAGVSDTEIQQDLLTKDDLTLDTAEKRAIAKESAKFSQAGLTDEKLQNVKSTYARSKSCSQSDNVQSDKKCRYCGQGKHNSREKECKAFSETCERCGKVGHFKRVCRSKKKEKQSKSAEENEIIEENDTCGGVFEISSDNEHQISSLCTGDIVYDNLKKKWVQKNLSDKRVNKLAVMISVCTESYAALKKQAAGKHASAPLGNKQHPQVLQEGIADTGCSTVCAGTDLIGKLGVKRSDLLESSMTLRVADGRRLSVVGAIPVIINTLGPYQARTKQMLHFVSELKNLFLSKRCLADLNIISPTFPQPNPPTENVTVASLDQDEDKAPCGCKIRTVAPDPPPIPYEPIEDNVDKIKEFIVQYYSSSTMNMCSHQKLPEIAGPPLSFKLKDGASPKAVHTPATVPVHWHDKVKEQLDRDVRMGILERVEPNEPAVWQHRMVVVRKQNGSPRRTVDMQALNQATIRQTHPLTSPYLKAMSVPHNVYKSVTDTWEGYHSIPLDTDSSKMTRFITPYGAFRYLRSPQGFQSSGDAFTKRTEKITAEVKDKIMQVDDSLLWGDGILNTFNRTCEYLTLMGRNGLIQNPEKFQFCQREVHWSGFTIGKDSVRPMPHITKAIRQFPVPVNKTDLRSFMALVQQVSYATAVAPLLLPFRNLLKEATPWNWTDEMDKTFQATREILAERIEEGIKLFDPYKITVLLSDWCKHGVGFILAQKHCKCVIKDNTPDVNCCRQGWMVCMVGSRFTSPAEANYSPTEGELLGVKNALHKTKYFTLGCPHLFVGTDHKPLLGILNEAPLESLDNPRLIKLKEKTLGWIFKTIYVPGKELGGTDALSRHGVTHEECVATRKHLISLLATHDFEDDDVVSAIGDTSELVTWEDVRDAASKDETCKKLKEWIAGGKPKSWCDNSSELKPFWRYREDLDLEESVPMFRERIFVPISLRKKVLVTLHSSHQGETGMLLRAERDVFWPGMAQDIKKMRAQCNTCNIYAPSQPSMPPIQPEVPMYPFQHICSDYFQLHGIEFCVIVDRFSNWFNIHHAKGGSLNLVDIFSKLFQDVGVAESLTTDGGSTYLSNQFQTFLKNYKVHHRVSSVAYPHGNTRSEVAVKSAKRLMRSNMNDRGDLNTVAITRALLEYRNTPDRDTGLSPAELLYGRQLKDFLPSKPHKNKIPKQENFREEWRNIADWREKALARRSLKVMDKLSKNTKDLPQLQIGDSVLVQNQLGNNPRRWEKRGTVVKVLPYRQYEVMMDGSRRVTLRNRQYLRRYEPLHIQEKYTVPEPLRREPDDDPAVDEHMHPNVARNSHGHEPRVTDQATSPHKDILRSQISVPDPNMTEPMNIPQLAPAPMSPAVPTHSSEPTIPTTVENLTQPSVPLPGPQPPAAQPGPRRSQRSGKGISNRYSEFHTGDEYDKVLDDEASFMQGLNAISEGHFGNGMLPPPMIVGEIVGSNGYLMALELPRTYWDKSAWWTANGWVWIQHKDQIAEISLGLPGGEIVG